MPTSSEPRSRRKALDKLLTVNECSERSGLSVAVIGYHVRKGNLPSLKYGPRKWFVRVRESDFQKFLDEMRIPDALPLPEPSATE